MVVAKAYPDIYPDEASRMAAFMTMDNPAMKAMLGPGYELERFVQGVGPLFANEMLLIQCNCCCNYEYITCRASDSWR